MRDIQLDEPTRDEIKESAMNYAGPPLDKIATALAKAQGEMSNAVMNKINPHFKSKYADLAAIRDATIPALSSNGLSMVQYTKMRGDNVYLHTMLLHTSGQFIESEYPLPSAADKPQVMGSAVTYAKRYSWAAMCAISADEDDYGNAASNGTASGPRVSKEQMETLSTLADEVEADKIRFAKHLKIGSLADLPAHRFEEARAALEAKRKVES